MTSLLPVFDNIQIKLLMRKYLIVDKHIHFNMVEVFTKKFLTAQREEGISIPSGELKHILSSVWIGMHRELNNYNIFSFPHV